MAADIMGRLKDLLDDPQAVEQLQGLLPEGTDVGELLQDPGKLLDMIKDNPDLRDKLQELVPDVDLEGALSSLTGAAAGAAGDAAAASGDAADAATDTAGGIIDKIKGLFGNR